MALILVVDDSQVQKVVMKKLLTEMQHKIILVSDGNQAYERALECLPDLILMDIMMPDCNGFQATRAIRKDPRVASIPIVMVSTKSLDIDKYWAEKQGAVGYITKPIDKFKFMHTINNVLEKFKKVQLIDDN